MNLKHKRERLQHGSLTIEERSNGKVWIFRYREPLRAGGMKQRKISIGLASKLTKTQAMRMCEQYREAANSPTPVALPQTMTFAELVEHFTKHELEGSDKTAKYISTCHSIFKLYLLPRWGTASIHGIKALEVEAWLKSLDGSNDTKASMRGYTGTYAAMWRRTLDGRKIRSEIFVTLHG